MNFTLPTKDNKSSPRSAVLEGSVGFIYRVKNGTSWQGRSVQASNKENHSNKRSTKASILQKLSFLKNRKTTWKIENRN